jgi:hypothetical protein
MKKLLFVIFSFGIIHVCSAQGVDKKEEFKFIPPLFRKKGATKSRDTIKYTPQVIQKNREVKFTDLYISKIIVLTLK